MRTRWALLDRDGTIVVRHHYLVSPRLVCLISETVEALKALASRGWKFGVVTNQSPVGRGLISIAELHAINSEMLRQLSLHGVTLEFILCCPHLPDDDCDCRKPRIGLFHEAVACGFDPSDAWMIGDSITDIEFGQAAGLNTVLISADCPWGDVAPTIRVDSLSQAVNHMVGEP